MKKLLITSFFILSIFAVTVSSIVARSICLERDKVELFTEEVKVTDKELYEKYPHLVKEGRSNFHYKYKVVRIYHKKGIFSYYTDKKESDNKIHWKEDK